MKTTKTAVTARRSIEIETEHFVWSYGHAPRGRGGWMFELMQQTGEPRTAEQITAVADINTIARVSNTDRSFVFEVSCRSMTYGEASRAIKTLVKALESDGRSFFRVTVLT